MKVKESLNVIFDESYPPTKLSPLVDDNVGEEEAIENNTKVVNNNVEDESIEVDKVVNIKESKNHPLEQVIGNLNQRTLRSQAQNHCNFFCFISTIEPINVNEALRDKSWVVAMQEELNQFIANDVWDLVPLPKSHTVIGTKQGLYAIVFPPLGSDVPVLVLPCHASSRKEMRVLVPKEVLTLPRTLRPSPRVPTNFNNQNPALLEPFHLSIHNLHRFLDKIQFVVELNFIQRNDHIIIHKASLEIRDMESVVNSTKLIGKFQLVRHRPNSFNNFEWHNKS
ncbi:retrovirus-related pol polyprotein from transposon TNT 1-94 [Tanacetum coccineum]